MSISLLSSLSQPTSILDGLPEWAPDVQDVADLLVTRTRTDGGRLLDIFNQDTIPTADQVSRYITRGVSRIIGRLGSSVMPSTEIAAEANELATIYAGMRVELSFFSEQINTNRSPYLELKKLWDDGLVALKDRFDQETTTDPTGGALSNMGSFCFPPTEIGDGRLP